MEYDDDDHPDDPSNRTDQDCDDIDRDTRLTEDAYEIQDKEDDNTDDRVVYEVHSFLQEIVDGNCNRNSDDDAKE